MPAHVTILYPFVPPDDVNGNVLQPFATAVPAIAAFDCRFTSTQWFGEDVLWPQPEPDRFL